MNNAMFQQKWISKLCSLAVGCSLFAASATLRAQTTAATASPDLQTIVKLQQAHMSDDVILGYIKNSGKSYNLSADDMLYLNSQGVSQAVISALLQTKTPAPAATAPEAVSAPAPAAPTPTPTPTPMPTLSPVMALFDNFATDAGLNMAAWTTHSPLLANMASFYASPMIMPTVVFGPGGMQMSGVNGPGQFTGVESVASYVAPFNLTVTVSAQSENGEPFAVHLVSDDMRQWISLTGHLGGRGHREGDLHVGGAFGFFRGGVSVPLGGGPSPEHGVWVNYTGSGQSMSGLGNKIFEHPLAGVPYTIQVNVAADGMASVTFMDAAGMTLGTSGAVPAGNGPFHLVLAERNGPTFANWSSVQLNPLAPIAPAPAAAPATPTIDYFQAQLASYGQWIQVDGIGSCWVPAEANIPGWRPYLDGGHWEYTDAGWYWQSDYAWGEIGFHYGRWIRDARTGFAWAWVPGYDWAPSWVCWRYSDADGCLGWAPLPWDARFDPAVGIVFRGQAAIDVDFGLGPDVFVFVGTDHFWEHDYHAFVFAPDRVRLVFGHSAIHNGYRMDHGHFVADGLGRDRVAAITHHEVVARQAHELRAAEEHHNAEARRVAMRDTPARDSVGREAYEAPGHAANSRLSKPPPANSKAPAKAPNKSENNNNH